MSRTLNALVRLAQFDVDERRRELKVIQEEEDRLKAEIITIDERIQSEKETARTTPEYAHAYARFLTWARSEKALLHGKIGALQPVLEHARDNLAEAFAELKKAEINLENWETRQKEELQRKEDQEMDELGMDRYRRSRKK